MNIADDLTRLHRILTFKQLGFVLSEIRHLLKAGAAAELAALKTQIALLKEQQRRTATTLDAALAFLQAAETGTGVFIRM